MPKSTVIDLEGIGPVEFQRRKNSRSIRVAIFTAEKIRCNFPWGCSFKKAINFVLKNSTVIQRRQQQLHLRAQQIQAKLANPRPDLEARKFLRQRLQDLAEKHGFQYSSVSIRSQKSRWGSCSENNSISLNRKLIRLPEYLRDYVLIHELVHTKYKHHQSPFWRRLDSCLGAPGIAKKRAKEIREFGILLRENE